MLYAVNKLYFVVAMFKFNKLIINLKVIRNNNNVKCAFYYHTTLSHYIITLLSLLKHKIFKIFNVVRIIDSI